MPTTAHTKRTPSSKRLVAIARMTAAGMPAWKIAEELEISERTVFEWRKKGKTFMEGSGVMFFVPEHIKFHDLEKEVQALIPLDRAEPKVKADAFERFFNRYSKKTMAPHSKRFVEMAFSSKRVLLNVPPRHAKSTIFSVWLPIWLIARDRNVQVIIISKTNKMALKFIREIGHHLQNNQKLIQDFGRFTPGEEGMWAVKTGQIIVAGRDLDIESGDLTLQAVGASQQVIGAGCNWLIADDVADLKNSNTPDQREKLTDWFDVEAMSRLEPGGRAVCIGTRCHRLDLYGGLAEKKVRPGEETKIWRHINYPAVSDGNGNPVMDFTNGVSLWPDRWPLNIQTAKEMSDVGDQEYTSLEEIFMGMGSQKFSQTYQQSPIAAGDRLVEPEWIFGDPEHIGCLDRTRAIGVPLDGEWVRVVSIDPSPSAYAAILVADVTPDRHNFRCVLLELQNGKMDVNTMRSHLMRIAEQYHPKYLVFERNAAQKWFVDDPWAELFLRDNRIRLLDHTTGQNKADPEFGFQTLSPEFEFGNIRIPDYGPISKAMFEPLIHEATNWTNPKDRDDCLMALWFIKNKIRRLKPTGGIAVFRNRMLPPRLQEGFRWQQVSA